MKIIFLMLLNLFDSLVMEVYSRSVYKSNRGKLFHMYTFVT